MIWAEIQDRRGGCAGSGGPRDGQPCPQEAKIGKTRPREAGESEQPQVVRGTKGSSFEAGGLVSEDLRCKVCGKLLSGPGEECSACAGKASEGTLLGSGVRATLLGTSSRSPAGEAFRKDERAVERTGGGSAEWAPKQDDAVLWARQQLDWWKLLGLPDGGVGGSGIDAPELRARVNKLRKKIDLWRELSDAAVQQSMVEAQRRLPELDSIVRMASEKGWASVEAEIRRQQAGIAAGKLRDQADSYISDGILQYHEYQTLRGEAEKEGLNEEQFSAILDDLETKGARVGVRLAGQRIVEKEQFLAVASRNLDSLVELLWAGPGAGELTTRLEQCLGMREAVREVEEVRRTYSDRKGVGAQHLLWRLGERGLSIGGVSLGSMEEWVTFVYEVGAGAYAPGSEGAVRQRGLFDTLTSGTLAAWFGEALQRPRLEVHARMAAEAIRQKTMSPGRALWTLVWKVEPECKGETVSLPKGVVVKESIIKADPEFWEAHCRLGFDYFKLGSHDDMKRHLKLALEHQDTLDTTVREMAYSLTATTTAVIAIPNLSTVLPERGSVLPNGSAQPTIRPPLPGRSYRRALVLSALITFLCGSAGIVWVIGKSGKAASVATGSLAPRASGPAKEPSVGPYLLKPSPVELVGRYTLTLNRGSASSPTEFVVVEIQGVAVKGANAEADLLCRLLRGGLFQSGYGHYDTGTGRIEIPGVGTGTAERNNTGEVTLRSSEGPSGDRWHADRFRAEVLR